MSELDRYSFLASAVAGRKISVHVSVKDDALAFSDGQTITVPKHDTNEADEANGWLAIAAQAALVCAGSLDPALLRQLIGRRLIVQRYAYLEVLRACRVCRDRLPWGFSQRTEIQEAAALTTSASESLSFAAGGNFLPVPPAYFGTIKPLTVLRRSVSSDGLSALTKNQNRSKITASDPVRNLPELDDDDEGEDSVLLRLLQNPFSSSSPFADVLNTILGAGVSRGKREASSDNGGGAEIPVGRVERSLRRGVSALIARLPFDLPELELAAASQALSYPEWDIYAKCYRNNWVWVEEVDPQRADGAQDLRNILRTPTRELRRQLASLGLDHELHRRQNEGSDLDTSALIDCAIDLRSGHSPHAANVYRASRRTRRDLAVVIVLDISGSTGEQDQQGESIFKKQVQLAFQLGLTLDALGDTVALFGFHSWGRKLVRVVRIKGHEERWSGLVAQRLSQLEPLGYTRIGTAIRHGAHLLSDSMRLPNRLLVLITDGIAYDQDYENTYAESDARKALQEATAMGTACVCLSVGSSTDTKKLAEVFGAANILAVNEVHEMTGHIREVFRQALACVSRRRLAQVSVI